MQTDSLFYRLFQTCPALFFELIGESDVEAETYTFRSVELKQTAFRMDGVFIPRTHTAETPVYFVEVQFQLDEQLYARLLSEVTIFLRQNPEVEQWAIFVIYGDRTCAPKDARAHAPFLRMPEIQLVYLDELPEQDDESIEMGLIRLIVEPSQTAVEQAQQLVQQATNVPSRLSSSEIIEMIETIVVYKFPTLSWQEVEAMFGLSELKQTRVYQQGREEGERLLILRQLNRRLGSISDDAQSQIMALTVEQLEVLGEALLDFTTADDLREWFSTHANRMSDA
ncbi:MAG: Rpn family recombination-promoting nuclease/putative transposase [Leptolyngbyaceae bacterium]|nr:Rpn family recombination-promoting nuclease/putative transposase [Leptolyngbyaceae bacterium]